MISWCTICIYMSGGAEITGIVTRENAALLRDTWQRRGDEYAEYMEIPVKNGETVYMVNVWVRGIMAIAISSEASRTEGVC